MKRTVFLAALLFTASAALYAAEFHVAATGNDTNPGTREKPLRTVQAAADRLKPGDTCVVHAGIYRESVVMKKSGSDGAPVRIQAAPGEKVVIDGSEILDLKWEKYRDGIYKASTKASFRQLFFDGVMMFEARWPNMASMDDLWKESRWSVAGPGSEYGKVVDPALAATGIDMTGATAVLNVYHQFYIWTRLVKEHSAGSSSFTYEKDLKGVGEEHLEAKSKKGGKEKEIKPPKADKATPGKDEKGEAIKFADDRYYLVGKLELLDAPGEWYLDAKSGTLYFYPPGGIEPTGHPVAVKQRDYGFSAEKQHHLLIDGLTFFACGISLKNCDDCCFENSSVLYSSCTEWERLPKDDPRRDLESLHPEITGKRNVIRNNLFAYGSQTGLFVDGTEDVIENNVFHDFGWLASLGHVPLQFTTVYAKPEPGSNCLIRCNTIYNAGGPLLHFNGRNNTVELNDLYNGMRAAFGGNKDVAMLYTQKDVTGSKARYNWVHDSAGGSTNNFWGNGIGIRGDDNTTGFTVEHNVIWNCGSASIMMKNVHEPTADQANAVLHDTTFNNSTMLAGTNKVDIILAINTPAENKFSTLCDNAAGQLASKWQGIPLPAGPNISHNYVAPKIPLMDSKNFDFRPVPGSPLVDAGRIIPGMKEKFVGKAPDIGAYESGSSDYWIPGRRERKATFPIVPDGAENVPADRDVLMWRPAYNAVSYALYFGTSKDSMQKAFSGTVNTFELPILGNNQTFFWRVDAVLPDGSVVPGDVWSFSTAP